MGWIWYYPCGGVVKVIRLLNLKTEKEQPDTPNGWPFIFIESRSIGAVWPEVDTRLRDCRSPGPRAVWIIGGPWVTASCGCEVASCEGRTACRLRCPTTSKQPHW
jgi:hypothetical protein